MIEKEESKEEKKEDEQINDKDTDIDNENKEPTTPATTTIPKEEKKENKTQNESKNLDVSSIDLIGSEEITLKVGDKYEELGAKAYNKNGEDISSKIKIDSAVDTTKPGTYTVSYSIGNWIVLRYVIVK